MTFHVITSCNMSCVHSQGGSPAASDADASPYAARLLHHCWLRGRRHHRCVLSHSDAWDTES